MMRNRIAPFNIVRLLVSITVCMLVLSFLFSGCAILGGDDGRMQAAKEIRVEEEKTKQEVLKTRQAELQTKQGQETTRNPTVKTTAYDENGKVVAVTEVDLQPALAELGLNKSGQGDTYGVELSTTPLPRGQAAETIEASTGLVAEVGRAPGTLVYATGLGIGRALKETGGGTKINGETVNIGDSFNRADNRALGSGNSVSGAMTTDKSQTSEIVELEPPAE